MLLEFKKATISEIHINLSITVPVYLTNKNWHGSFILESETNTIYLDCCSTSLELETKLLEGVYKLGGLTNSLVLAPFKITTKDVWTHLEIDEITYYELTTNSTKCKLFNYALAKCFTEPAKIEEVFEIKTKELLPGICMVQKAIDTFYIHVKIYTIDKKLPINLKHKHLEKHISRLLEDMFLYYDFTEIRWLERTHSNLEVLNIYMSTPLRKGNNLSANSNYVYLIEKNKEWYLESKFKTLKIPYFTDSENLEKYLHRAVRDLGGFCVTLIIFHVSTYDCTNEEIIKTYSNLIRSTSPEVCNHLITREEIDYRVTYLALSFLNWFLCKPYIKQQ